MQDELPDKDFEDVSSLIKEEEEEALALFRSGDFRRRLEVRLRGQVAERKRAVLIPSKLVPVLGALLLLAVAAALFFTLNRPGSGPPSEFEALASTLSQLPGFSHFQEPEWAVSTGQPSASRLADSIRQALVTAEQIKKEEEQQISIPAGAGKVPRLSPGQRMEILFQERAIERALRSIKDDPKEV